MVQFFLIYRLSVHVSSCPLTLPDVGQAILISTVVLVQAFLLSQYCLWCWPLLYNRRTMHENVVDYGQKNSSKYKSRKKADLWHKSYYLVVWCYKDSHNNQKSKIMNHKITHNSKLSSLSLPTCHRTLFYLSVPHVIRNSIFSFVILWQCLKGTEKTSSSLSDGRMVDERNIVWLLNPSNSRELKSY